MERGATESPQPLYAAASAAPVGRALHRGRRGRLAQAPFAEQVRDALVQDLLGHQTDAMTRRYTSAARRSTAAAVMPRYAMV